jgi:hypothetical protein
MAPKALPSQEALRQLLAYVPETGALIWRPRPLPQWTSSRKVLYLNRCAGQEAFRNECRKGYRNGRFDGVHYQAHRIIWKLVHNEEHPQIDHINGVKNDNRLLNLRPASNAENTINYDRPPGSSKYRGVSFLARENKWRASIGHEMRKIALGEFRDEEAAARAYDAAAIRLHGEFARLNFPQEVTA